MKRIVSAWIAAAFAAAVFFMPWLHTVVEDDGTGGACAKGCAHDPAGDSPDNSGHHSPEDCPACHFAKAGILADAPSPSVPRLERLAILPCPQSVHRPAARSSVRLPPSCGPPRA